MKDEIKCPYCRLPLKFNISASGGSKKNEVIVEGKIEEVSEKYKILYSVLLNYLRWKLEGKPKYGKQYYYDLEHNRIIYEKDGIFSFEIQVHNSPDGDRWWIGKFSIRDGFIEILEEDFIWR